MIDIQNWANENSGYLSIYLTLFAAIIAPIIFFVLRTKKKNLDIRIIEQPTMCSSYSVGVTKEGDDIHHTAFLIYLRLTNIGDVPIQISDIHVGYRSEKLEEPKEYRWLLNETAMLEDYCAPLGEKVKVIPFFKQQNTLIDNDTSCLLNAGCSKNGLVYFEQEQSLGLDHPYMDEDFKVNTIVKIHDTLGNFWEYEFRTIKVLIKVIREIHPTFGLSREQCE